MHSYTKNKKTSLVRSNWVHLALSKKSNKQIHVCLEFYAYQNDNFQMKKKEGVVEV